MAPDRQQGVGGRPPNQEPSSSDPSSSDPSSSDIAEVLTWAKISALSRRVSAIEADEVAQVTAEKIWRSWNKPSVEAVRSQGTAKRRAYVSVVARNTYRDLVREHQRRLARNARSADRSLAQLPDRPGVNRPTVSEVAAAHAGRLVLVESLAILPGRQRVIAYLIIARQLTPSEVGEMLNIEAQTVRKHLRSAKEALRDHIAQAEAI